MQVVVFFAAAGQQPEFGLTFEMEQLPPVGTRLQISRKGLRGSVDGVVLAHHWNMRSEEDRTVVTVGDEHVGEVSSYEILCEAVISPFSDEEHRKTFPGAREVPT